MSTHKINRACLAMMAAVSAIAFHDCQVAIAQPPPIASALSSDSVLALENTNPLGMSEYVTVFAGKPGVPKRRVGGGTR